MAQAQTARQIAAQTQAGDRSAVETCREAFGRIERLEPTCRAFLELTREYAEERAREIDRAAAAGQSVGALAGVPIAVKDNLCTTFSATTAGSRMLAGYRSPYNATVIERIEAAGAIIVGKANLDEFSMGSSCENSGFHPTHNPWDPSRVPGGTSGGPAAAVAARMAPLALGSDTGGSIRQPAAFCGIVGLKPTYGRVSRYGLVAYGSSLDQIGPLSTNVADAALLLGVIAGHDSADSTCVDRPVPDYLGELSEERLKMRAATLRIGVPKEYFGAGLDAEVQSAVEQALAVYRGLGAALVDISLPHTKHCVAAYYLVATAECSSNLARYDGMHYGHRADRGSDIVDLSSRSRAEGFGAEVKRRLMLGTFALSAGYHDAYYEKALRVRRLIKQDYDAAFERVDVIACPTAPTPAFKLGEKLDDPLQMYLADIYTTALNLAGLPGISVPCGFSSTGLPIGLQLIAPIFDEPGLLQAARLFERETPWASMSPEMAA
jgi:aspartyl-tRNA(Asn)/glutamyl-tRNA(Gln) amidotransferase subunit A